MMPRGEGEIIETLYDAALGRQLWEDSARQLADYLGGNTLLMATYDPRGSAAAIVTTLGMPSRIVQEYAHFAQHDLWAMGALQRRLGQTFTSPQVVEDRVLLRSYIYNEYFRPQVDARHVVGSLWSMDGGHVGIFGTHRPNGVKEFAPREVERLRRLLPHLQRAFEIRQRLQVDVRQAHSVYLVLDRLRFGVILIGATGRLLHANVAGETILRSADGLVRTSDGLRASNKEDDRRLQRLISGLRQGTAETRSAGGHLRVRRPSGRQAYAVMLAPAGPMALGERHAPAILVFVSDPGRKIASDLAVLSELFGFTPAEGRLVLALLAGMAPPEFARKTGVSYNTVKTLLARAMGRTDSRSQVELVLLVAGALGGVVPVTLQDQ